MSKMGRNYSVEFKAKVALAVSKDDKTLLDLGNSLRFIRIKLRYGNNNFWEMQF